MFPTVGAWVQSLVRDYFGMAKKFKKKKERKQITIIKMCEIAGRKVTRIRLTVMVKEGVDAERG